MPISARYTFLTLVFAFAGSVAVYIGTMVFLRDRLAPIVTGLPEALTMGIPIVAIACVIASVLVLKYSSRPLTDAREANDGPARQPSKPLSTMVVSLALAEAPAVLGLVHFLLSRYLLTGLVFCLVSLIVILGVILPAGLSRLEDQR